MAGHRTIIGATLAMALFSGSLASPARAQAPGMMGCDLPSIARMPLMMPDDFSEMNLVTWRVERGTPLFRLEPDPEAFERGNYMKTLTSYSGHPI